MKSAVRNQHRRRHGLVPGLGAACGLLLAATRLAAAEPAVEPLRVYGNTSVIELTPVLVAAQSHGTPVTVHNGGVPDLFRPDRAHLSTNAETQALRVSVDNPDLRIIMTVAEGLYRVVARRSAGIDKLSDLKGKRIATVPITSAGYFLHRILREAGLDYADVTVVTSANMQQVADQLVAGELDAVTFWEPGIDDILLRLGDDGIEFSGKGVYREVFNLNTTATQLADPLQRRRIVEFVRSILKATKSLHADPRAGWTAMARSSGFDQATIARTWHHHRYIGEVVPDLLDVLEDEERFLAREAKRPARPRAELAKLIDTSVLEEALAGHPELRITPPSQQQVRLQAERLRTERLSASLRHATAIRSARRVQQALNHYREAGLWQEAAQLFTRDATAQVGTQSFSGPRQIAAYFQAQALEGTGRSTLGEGDLNTHIVLSPVVTADWDGRVVRGRWRELSMLGRFGSRAEWANGIYENEYVEEDGVWKIRRLHYYPTFAGPYTPGWRNVDRSDKVTVVPFHFTPDGAGTPIPLAPGLVAADRAPADEAGLKRRVAALQAQLICLQEQSRVQSLQNAYGYYVDRRMWDDVADLFAADGTFEAGHRGIYRGRAGIRRALGQYGPQDLAVGVINDHTQMQPVITMAADCHSARARVTELVQAGQNGQDAWWGINIHENSYRRIDGRWQLQSVQITRRMRTDYAKGWALSAEAAVPAAGGFAPDAPPSAKRGAYPAFDIPPMHFGNPGKGGRPFGNPAAKVPDASLEQMLADAERALDVVVAQDAGENVSNAYGYYIDEFLWDNTADVFAVNGSKELSGVGNYIGRERVRDSLFGRYGSGGRRAASMTLHQKTAPVVTVAPDGRSAWIRTKLVQLNSARDGDGSYMQGIYENKLVRERGVWKIERMDLDYTWNANYSTGWGKVAERPARAAAPAGQATGSAPVSGAPAASAPAAPASARTMPQPDGPLRGVTTAPYPGLATMAFHYVNPVSGRAPPELLPP